MELDDGTAIPGGPDSGRHEMTQGARMEQSELNELRGALLGIHKALRNVFTELTHLRVLIWLSVAQVVLLGFIAWELRWR
jgi:hypothetical protein